MPTDTTGYQTRQRMNPNQPDSVQSRLIGYTPLLKRKRQVQQLLLMAMLVFVVILGIRLLAKIEPQTLPVSGLQDKAQALVVGDHEHVQADIERINNLLQAQTFVILSHPLQPVPPAPLPHRGIWLAYDPDTQETAVQLGEGLQTPPHTMFLLGTRLQPFVAANVRLVALRPLSTRSKVHLMLNQIVQPYAPQAMASLVAVPGY
jgi:hypothetical protein